MNPAAILTQLGDRADSDKASSGKTLPPVDQWHPEHCGEMDLIICSDGRWMHEGTPIGRARLVHMLSRVLRREPDGSYCLVTPVEKVTIRVEDCPFLAVDCTLVDPEVASDSAQQPEGDDVQHSDDGAQKTEETHNEVWQLITDQGDGVRLEGDTRLMLSKTPDGLWLPEVPVRFGLSARLHRNLHYRLLESAEIRDLDDGSQSLGFMSGGQWQSLGQLSAEEMDA